MNAIILTPALFWADSPYFSSGGSKQKSIADRSFKWQLSHHLVVGRIIYNRKIMSPPNLVVVGRIITESDARKHGTGQLSVVLQCTAVTLQWSSASCQPALLFNRIRKMTSIVSADAKSLLNSNQAAYFSGLPRSKLRNVGRPYR